ncbi:DMT family transporter [Rhodovulum sp. ES.010]|uniref:DMT family transporter n=1 Tax=Rhodovulum sp. ES.010 TaxID=1882821 RepID=UPI002110B815|nr:DMT family transporter [Rhodovulum sp. ES.010]
MALFGSATPMSKIIGDAFPVFTASFARMVIASAVLAPIVWLTTARFTEMRRSDLWVMMGIAAAGMVGFTATMLFGMRLTTGVIGATIMSSTPAVTALAAVLFLGAAMNWRKAGALSLAVAGCVAINLLRDPGAGDGDAVALGAILVALAVCLETAFTLLSRRLSEGITSLEATLGASLMAMPLFVALALIFDSAPFQPLDAGAWDWAALVYWGAATGGLAPVLWYRGVRSAPGALTAASMAVMPLTALGLSYLLLGEAFRWVHLLGFGLVFAGLALMILEQATRD